MNGSWALVRAAVVLVAASTALAFVSCGNEVAPLPARVDSAPAPETGGFHFDTSTSNYPDSLQGLVAAHLVGCQGSEPNCHGGGQNPAHLAFGDGPESDLLKLVNVASSERPDLKRVMPRDPAHSWLLLKLRNDRDAGVEAAMPLGSDGDPVFAALVEEWIVVGAPTSMDAAPAEDDADADAGDAGAEPGETREAGGDAGDGPDGDASDSDGG